VQKLVIELGLVWADFERMLDATPILTRLREGTITLADYQRLLVNLRQQVMEGARWIARAASSLSIELFPLRSMFITHAGEEHRDFQILERDYVATGGDLHVIQSAPKNVGSEALSAFMFHRASQPDPLDLLGAMFIIEGLGTAKAHQWAEQLKDTLKLEDQQVKFLSYHGGNDDRHFDKLRDVVRSGFVDDAVAARIVKTARTVARLYALQLEEIDHV
jgi:3-oxoacyl-[acyl-carrier-protein] synthase-3